MEMHRIKWNLPACWTSDVCLDRDTENVEGLLIKRWHALSVGLTHSVSLSLFDNLKSFPGSCYFLSAHEVLCGVYCYLAGVQSVSIYLHCPCSSTCEFPARPARTLLLCVTALLWHRSLHLKLTCVALSSYYNIYIPAALPKSGLMMKDVPTIQDETLSLTNNPDQSQSLPHLPPSFPLALSHSLPLIIASLCIVYTA